MDMIKMEPSIDPLDLHTSDATHTEDKKPLLKDGNLLDLHGTGIKTECVDHNSDLLLEIKVDDTVMKCEAEEQLCELDTVKDELKLEVTAEENEILADSVAETNDSTVSSEFISFGHEELTIIYQVAKHSVHSTKMLRAHTDEKRFKCNVCEKCFSNSSNLRRHVLKHTGKKAFKCDICGKCFFEQRHRKSHARQHTGEKPFICDVCGRCFSHSGTLKSHTRQHTGEKPFKCNVCGKCFSQSATVLSHERRHTGEKPFKCDCGKCFSQLSNLKSHECKHTGEKPFKCNLCGVSFPY
ncbi:zinc finger protein 22-like isoform X6 [Periplaneta americana]